MRSLPPNKENDIYNVQTNLKNLHKPVDHFRNLPSALPNCSRFCNPSKSHLQLDHDPVPCRDKQHRACYTFLSQTCICLPLRANWHCPAQISLYKALRPPSVDCKQHHARPKTVCSGLKQEHEKSWAAPLPLSESHLSKHILHIGFATRLRTCLPRNKKERQWLWSPCAQQKWLQCLRQSTQQQRIYHNCKLNFMKSSLSGARTI